jgi:hypothetical protein
MKIKASKIIIVLTLAVVAMALYLLSPMSWDETFRQPLMALLGAPGLVNVTLLEVSSAPAPVREAGWRLLRPFGMVQFIRSIPPVSTVSDPSDSSTKKSLR